MKIFSELLEEALNEKSFNTEEELIKTIRSVLRKSSIQSYQFKKDKSGFEEPLRHGYSYKSISINGSLKITLQFIGVSQSDINEIASALAKAKINYQINNHSSTILIKGDDNILPEALISDNTKTELESSVFNVLGTKVRNKSDINNIISGFSSTQLKIYQELKKFDLVKWDYIKAENGRYYYTLVKK